MLTPINPLPVETDLKLDCDLTTLCHGVHDCTLSHMNGIDTHNTNNMGCIRSSGPKLELPLIKPYLLTEIRKMIATLDFKSSNRSSYLSSYKKSSNPE